MADIKQQIVTKVIIDNKDAVASLEVQTKAQENVTKATEENSETTKKNEKATKESSKTNKKNAETVNENTSALDGMAQALGINTQALKGTASGVKSVMKGFKVFNTVLGASLIGVVALALAGMVAWMKRTEEGGDKLSEIMAGLNGVMEGVFDVLSSGGKIAFEVVTTAIDVLLGSWTLLVNSFISKSLLVRKAWATLKGDTEALTEINKELNEIREENSETILKMTTSVVESGKAIVEESKELVKNVKAIKEKTIATIELQKIENDLNKTIRKNTVDEAKRRNEIQKNLLVTRDFTKTYDERRAALLRANELEFESLKAQEDIAATQLKLAKERDAINDSDKEAKQAVADAEANLINVRTASFARQRELQNRITEQNNKQIAELKAIDAARKAEDATAQSIADKKQARIDAAELKLVEAREKERERQALELEDERERENELLAIEEQRFQRQIEATNGHKAELELIEFEHQVRVNKIKEDAAKQNEKLNKAETKSVELSTDQQLAVSGTAVESLGGLIKDNAISSAVINIANGITAALALGPVGIPTIPGIIATGAAQLGIIKAVETVKASKGLMIEGASHDFGGVNVMTPNGMIEAEGGEFIMNKASTAMFKDELSAISQAGGGVPLAERGMMIEGASKQSTLSGLSSNIENAVSKQQVVLVTEDLQNVQTRVNATEEIATL